jgi:hypothetical protein
MSNWLTFRPLGIFYGRLVYFTSFWYIFTRFGTLYQEQSGNPAAESRNEQACLPVRFLPPFFDETMVEVPNLT